MLRNNTGGAYPTDQFPPSGWTQAAERTARLGEADTAARARETGLLVDRAFAAIV